MEAVALYDDVVDVVLIHCLNVNREGVHVLGVVAQLLPGTEAGIYAAYRVCAGCNGNSELTGRLIQRGQRLVNRTGLGAFDDSLAGCKVASWPQIGPCAASA